MRQPPQSSRVIVAITIISFATSSIGYGITVSLFGQKQADRSQLLTNIESSWASSIGSHEVVGT